LEFLKISPLEQFNNFTDICSTTVPGLLGVLPPTVSRAAIVSFSSMLIAMWVFYSTKKNVFPAKAGVRFASFLYDGLFQNVFKSTKMKDLTVVFCALFFCVLLLNIGGLLPYVFTLTSQLSTTAFFALSFFACVVLGFAAVQKLFFPEFFFMEGPPVLLVPLLLPIEKISYFFRAISLPVRPFANMTAGHSLTKVIASFVFMAGKTYSKIALAVFFGAVFFFTIVITSLEIFICVLQAYILCMLLVLYSLEQKVYHAASKTAVFKQPVLNSAFLVRYFLAAGALFGVNSTSKQDNMNVALLEQDPHGAQNLSAAAGVENLVLLLSLGAGLVLIGVVGAYVGRFQLIKILLAFDIITVGFFLISLSLSFLYSNESLAMLSLAIIFLGILETVIMVITFLVIKGAAADFSSAYAHPAAALVCFCAAPENRPFSGHE